MTIKSMLTDLNTVEKCAITTATLALIAHAISPDSKALNVYRDLAMTTISAIGLGNLFVFGVTSDKSILKACVANIHEIVSNVQGRIANALSPPKKNSCK